MDVVINIRLSNRQIVTPEDHDSLDRTWYGFDPGKSDEELWANNRGRYSLADARLKDEKYAAFVFEGRVVAVAEVTGHEVVDHRNAHKQRKIALIGRPLSSGDPVHDTLINTDQGRGRFTIWYTPDPQDTPQVAGHAVLLTWNPINFDWGDDYLDAIDRTTNGERVESEWSTGSRKTDLAHGDRAYLLRQGKEPRGIVASGWLTGTVHDGKHWDRSGRAAHYVNVEWDTVLAAQDALPWDKLEAEMPTQDWTPQGSGTSIRPENLEPLERLWAEHLTDITSVVVSPRPGDAGGQGRILDPIARKKIEDAAQDRLMKHYKDKHWTVVDTRYGNPYDAVARKGKQEIYLEAKGTMTPGYSITITRGEVDHARTHPGVCVIGIWSDMTFLDDGEIDPDNGTFKIIDFDPDEGSLEVIDYRWKPKP